MADVNVVVLLVAIKFYNAKANFWLWWVEGAIRAGISNNA